MTVPSVRTRFTVGLVLLVLGGTLLGGLLFARLQGAAVREQSRGLQAALVPALARELSATGVAPGIPVLDAAVRRVLDAAASRPGPGGHGLWWWPAGLMGLGVLSGVSLLFRRLVELPERRMLQALDSPQSTGNNRRSLGAVADLVARAGSETMTVREALDDLLVQWRARSQGAGESLGTVRGGFQSAQDAAGAIAASAEQLEAKAQEIRVHLKGIASSTSDNSTSLIEMSASIDEVANGSDQLSQHVSTTAAAVFQMVRSIGEVADRVEVLSQETDNTASSMAQIDSSTREIEVNAREATGLSGRMAEAAREGSRAVQETLEGIHSSYQVIRETARAMDELSGASRAIGGVVKIINEINDKTKLLSLNAAIIAAQAGEHGKSFAVVAHEIKNLSDRTAVSTGEISRLIRGIRERMEVASEAVERGEGSTARSVGLAERAGESLQRILNTAQVSHDKIREILRATEEQSRGSEKVMASMQEVSAMVNYIREAAQEHRTSGERVSVSAETMRDLTEQVKFATAEQAEVSRYISEAISTIDRNLATVLGAVESERRQADLILSQARGLQESAGAEAFELQALDDAWSDLGGAIAALCSPAAEAGVDPAAQEGDEVLARG